MLEEASMTKRDERIAEIKDFVKDMKEETNAYYGTRGNDYINLHKHVEFLITELEKEIERGRKARVFLAESIDHCGCCGYECEWLPEGEHHGWKKRVELLLAEYDQESEK